MGTTEVMERNEIDPALPLLNDKHEAFAWKYALGGSQTDAYIYVYQCQREAAHATSSKLLADTRVRNRVDFIQRAQTDAAFATITRNLHATKTIVHDADAVLTQVPDPTAQIAAATTILKANGRITSVAAATGEGNVTNYNTMVIATPDSFSSIADKIMNMNVQIMQRKAQKAIIVQAEAASSQIPE